jgi:hypothetical protein
LQDLVKTFGELAVSVVDQITGFYQFAGDTGNIAGDLFYLALVGSRRQPAQDDLAGLQVNEKEHVKRD